VPRRYIRCAVANHAPPAGDFMDLASINAQIATAVGSAPAVSSGTAPNSSDFASSLDAALKAVSRSQAQSDELQQQFALQNPNASLEDTVVAMSKASISFAAAVQVRNRLVQAYDQIMNMQV
jgi:flagellar hook-basal body complex protein FliE